VAEVIQRHRWDAVQADRRCRSLKWNQTNELRGEVVLFGTADRINVVTLNFRKTQLCVLCAATAC